MLERLRPRLTYANVVSTVCLFILLGGSAFAAARLTGRDIKNNSLTGRDVKNGSLVGRDVENNSLTGRDIRGLRRRDFARGQAPTDGASGPKGDPGPAGPAGPAGPTGPTLGRSNMRVCNPTNVSDAVCSTLTFSLPQAGRVLLIGTGSWHEEDPADGAHGSCGVEADGVTLDGRGVGQDTPTHTETGIGGPNSGTLALNGVSEVLPAGEHTFRIQCRENEGDIRFQTALSAVALGPG